MRAQSLGEMTVGIAVMNENGAAVVSDRQATTGSRESNTEDKIFGFITPVLTGQHAYHGVIFGAGDANQLNGVKAHTRHLIKTGIPASFDEFVATLHGGMKSRYEAVRAAYCEAARGELEDRAQLYHPDFRQNIAQRFDGDLERFIQSMQSQVIAVAYDKARDCIRAFFFNKAMIQEVFANQIVIGSGADGAHMYFVQKLPGVPQASILSHDMLFFALGAYVQSLANTGVGGEPAVAMVSNENVRPLLPDACIFLNNVVSAYQAEYPGLNRGNVRDAVGRTLSGDLSVRDEMASVLKRPLYLLEEDLPQAGSWQRISNALTFGR